ncbi:MAG: hypothetical protein ACE5G8_02950, partial [Anaerolineae bacterium]
GIVAASSRLLTWDGGRIDFAGTSLNFYGHAWKVGDGDPDLDRYAQNRPILAPSGGAMIIDRAIFLDVGGFDEDFFAYFEDVDLGWRLWVMGYRVTLAANSVAYHVHQGSWGKVQMAKRLVLYERNAIMGMVKNYDDESLARLLPVALMLLLRRAYLYAAPRLQEAAYRPPNGAGEPPPRVEAPPAPPPSQAYSAAYYWRVAWQTLRAGGARALWRRIRLELARRPLPGGRELAARLVQPALKRHFQPVSPLTVSLLLAGNDIAKELPQLMEKRAFIQARRRRPDAEILKLFGAPFQTNHAAPAYRQSQDSLVELFGITELFPGANHPPEVNDP